jgi:hypothetical protein
MTTEHTQRLVIRVSRNSLAFSTSDGHDVTFERYPLRSSISLAANMREALKQVPLLQNGFYRVKVITDAPILMTPVDLFREEEKEELYHHTFTQQQQVAVVHSVVPELNAVAIFTIQKDLRQVLTDQYGSVSVLPLMIPVWQHLYQKSFTSKNGKLYGYFHDRKLEVFSFGQNRFKFYNSFAVNEYADALYFLLATWKLLGFAPQQDELHLYGDIPEKEQFVEQASQYVKRIFVNNPSGEFNRAPVTQIENMPYDMMLQYLRRS